MGWWESQPKNQTFFILKITHNWWKYWRSVGKRFPNLYYWCKIPPQSLIFPYCALNQRNPLGELQSIKGEINLPLDWLTVQKAKLTWQSELDDSLSSQQSYSVQGKVDNKVNCIGGNWLYTVAATSWDKNQEVVGQPWSSSTLISIIFSYKLSMISPSILTKVYISHSNI